jgi:hypothetical protein
MGQYLPLRSKLVLGKTSLSRNALKQIMREMGPTWKGKTYHILKKNCNHFCEAFSSRLVGQELPGYINRLAWLGSKVECLLPMKALGLEPPQEEQIREVSDDLETAWGNGYSLSDKNNNNNNNNNNAEGGDERRALLASAAAKRLEGAP